MRYSKCSSIVTLSFLTASLITTSFGGAFATVASAATSEVSIQEQNKADNKDLLIGVAAVGLIALLSSNHGGSTNVPSSKSTTTPTVTPAATAGAKTATAATTTAEKTAFDLLNADRARNGLKPLKLNSQLTVLGGNYAQDMINRNFFAHNNPEGMTPFDRMRQAGISYNTAGENLAINSNVNTAEVAFMNSAGHKANILNTTYTDVGIGVRYDANGAAHVVQEFIGK